MITPPGEAKCGSAACVTAIAPLRLISISSRHSLSGNLSSDRATSTPALLTTMSILPN